MGFSRTLENIAKQHCYFLLVGRNLVRNERWKFFPFPWWAVKESGPRKYVDLIDVTEFSLSVYLTMFDHISIMIPHSFFFL